MKDIKEAATHARNVADTTWGTCSTEHRQLAEWLDELLRLRAYVDEALAIEAERDQLRERVVMLEAEVKRLKESR